MKMRVANLDEVKVNGGQQSSINMRYRTSTESTEVNGGQQRSTEVTTYRATTDINGGQQRSTKVNRIE